MSLESIAMLVKLTTANWSATKQDKRVAAQVTREHNAEGDAAKVLKRLIASAHLRSVRVAIQHTRQTHIDCTLPWDVHGNRLLPVKRHREYEDRIGRCIDIVARERDLFINEYETLILEARTRLGTMFVASDFPPPSALTDKFAAKYEISPVPAARHFVADMVAADMDRIRSDIERRVQVKVDHAVLDIYDRTERALRRLIKRLGTDDDGKPRRIHASALESVRDIAEAIPAMNITDDPTLATMAEALRRHVKDVEIASLRSRGKKDEAVQIVTARREKLAGDLNTIAEAYFGPAPEPTS